MAQINVILWDVDGTLLDFSAAERRALEDCFRSFQMGPCTPELLARYSQINRTYWRRLERGELTKPQVLLGRFEEFFAQEGLNCRDIPAFNQEYQLRLGDTVVFRLSPLHICRCRRSTLCCARWSPHTQKKQE